VASSALHRARVLRVRRERPRTARGALWASVRSRTAEGRPALDLRAGVLRRSRRFPSRSRATRRSAPRVVRAGSHGAPGTTRDAIALSSRGSVSPGRGLRASTSRSSGSSPHVPPRRGTGSRAPEAIPSWSEIVAVTKGFGPDEVAAAFAAGLTDFGENYADELISKWRRSGRGEVALSRRCAAQQGRPPRPVRDCWQAVARVVEGEAIMRHRAEISRGAPGVALPPAAVGRAPVTAGGGRHDRSRGPGGCAPEQVPGVVAGLQEIGCRVDG